MSISSGAPFDVVARARDAAPGTTRWGRRRMVLAVVVWAVAMACAFVALWRYKTTPGPAGTGAPPAWPADLGLGREPGRGTIVMLAHPKCTCTRASIGELAVLMTRLREEAHAYVLFMTPHGAPDGWEKSDTWVRAAAIPGVQVIADRDGAIAARLGATVSGHTVVYDAAGRLTFEGGITGARGHEGDNAGRRAIVTVLGGPKAAPERAPSTPTFGCELADASTSAPPGAPDAGQ